jgi:hypothetical protein
MSLTTTTQRNDLFDEISEWPRSRRILAGLIAVPILSCYITIVPLAVFISQVGLFTDFRDNFGLSVFAAIGCAIYLKWTNVTWTRWIPTVLLAIAQCVIIAIAKKPSQWVYGLPAFVYSVGTPALALFLFPKFAKRVGLVA